MACDRDSVGEHAALITAAAWTPPAEPPSLAALLVQDVDAERAQQALAILGSHSASTPTPLPSRIPAKTTAPQPTATVTVTSTVTPKPDDVPLTDHLQGWGTAAAVLVALGLAIVETRRRRRDQADAESQRAGDRADADRRLLAERAAADRRLQQQIDEQRDRDRRQFIAEQLQNAANLWAKKEIFELPGVLAAIPDEYATIVRFLVRGEDYNDAAGFPPMSDITLAALEKQLTRPGRGLVNHGKEQYLVDRVRQMEENLARQGKSKDWSKLHPAAVELFRVGYDYKKVKQAWSYEEIGENIAEVLAGAPDKEEPTTR